MLRFDISSLHQSDDPCIENYGIEPKAQLETVFADIGNNLRSAILALLPSVATSRASVLAGTFCRKSKLLSIHDLLSPEVNCFS